MSQSKILADVRKLKAVSLTGLELATRLEEQLELAGAGTPANSRKGDMDDKIAKVLNKRNLSILRKMPIK